jgi:transposase-like protein
MLKLIFICFYNDLDETGNCRVKILLDISIKNSEYETHSINLSLSQFENISHESVRIYYHKIKEVLDKPNKVVRNLIAIDETKLKLLLTAQMKKKYSSTDF